MALLQTNEGAAVRPNTEFATAVVVTEPASGDFSRVMVTFASRPTYIVGGTKTVIFRRGANCTMNFGRSSWGWNVFAAVPLIKNETSTGSGETRAVAVKDAVVWPNRLS